MLEQRESAALVPQIIPVETLDDEQWWVDLLFPGGHVKQIDTLADPN